ncbi:hypothetical protein F2Q68_00035809 [Brassica cretica]|uniref:Uncharacterized protein n=1 Tax=Brassica cretica TaxID=69181 RepID=A0A8S9H3Z7_BRACR|nr:hypothetical protein F2Q68_00035809 [Brassica cretica]
MRGRRQTGKGLRLRGKCVNVGLGPKFYDWPVHGQVVRMVRVDARQAADGFEWFESFRSSIV